MWNSKTLSKRRVVGNMKKPLSLLNYLILGGTILDGIRYHKGKSGEASQKHK